MPGTWPLADYTLAAMAVVVLGYVVVTVLKRRNGEQKKPDLTQVVENNTKAMQDLSGMVNSLHDFMLQATTKQGMQLEEVVSFVRGQRGGGGT